MVFRGQISVPLRYESPSPLNLTLPVVVVNRNASKTPIVFLGPGNGGGNLPSDFGFVPTYFPENPLIFVGYRGVESDPTPPDSDISALARLETSALSDVLLTKIAKATESAFTLSDFWIAQRSKDVEKALSELGIEFVHLLGIGESGSRIAHYFASSNPKRVVRMSLLNAGVPVPHRDTPVRLLAVYRALCRRDPTCPYPHVKWVPEDAPTRVLTIFTIGREKLAFSAYHQLQNPSTAVSAIDTLQAITDGASMGFLALSGFQGPELMKINWPDYVMHSCAKPRDASIPVLPAVQQICEKLHEIVDTYPAKLEVPVLLVNGELEIPRARTVLSYFQNESLIPSIVDQIVLNATASKYELLREDVLRAVLGYLNNGETEFVLDPPPPIVWKVNRSITKSLKWAMTGGLATSLIGTAFIYWRATKSDAAKPTKRHIE
jgi:pimeloyl-ACP methyl ester carboxylesterase